VNKLFGALAVVGALALSMVSMSASAVDAQSAVTESESIVLAAGPGNEAPMLIAAADTGVAAGGTAAASSSSTVKMVAYTVVGAAIAGPVGGWLGHVVFHAVHTAVVWASASAAGGAYVGYKAAGK